MRPLGQFGFAKFATLQTLFPFVESRPEGYIRLELLNYIKVVKELFREVANCEHELF